MDKEVVVHIHNGILLIHKKEHIWVSSNEVDETRTYYTMWSKSEKDKYHILTYIWNLEKWYWRIYLHGRNRETDIENGIMDKEGGEEGEGEVYGESNMEIYITICKIESQWEFAIWLRELKPGLWFDSLEGWEVGGGRDF